MSGSLFFRFAFTVLAVFIVCLVLVERDDHAFRLTISFTYSAMPATRGLNTYSHSACAQLDTAHQIPGFSLDRTWRHPPHECQVEHGEFTDSLGARAYLPPAATGGPQPTRGSPSRRF